MACQLRENLMDAELNRIVLKYSSQRCFIRKVIDINKSIAK